MSRRPPPHLRNTDKALGARLRDQTGEPWNKVKKLIQSGKVFVDGVAVTDAGHRPAAEATIEVRLAAKTPRRGPEVNIVFQDAHVVVIDKPAGVSSVPYHGDERDTALDLIRAAWRRRGESATGALHVVHRIDKDTSGLLMFARSKSAEIALAAQLRDHSVERLYTCVANGAIESQRIESLLIRDRGDGLRGSNRHDNKGKRSVTFVEAKRGVGSGALPATLCQVRLETGRTHQIRIHLSETGHPLVGERVYSRDFTNDGRPLHRSPRLLLHAQTLGFQHPTRDEIVRFESPLPDDFQRAMNALKTGKPE